MGGIVLFKGLDLYVFFSGGSFLGVLELSFHIVTGSGHEILEFIPFLFEMDFGDFFLVEQVVELDGDDVEFLDLILEHDL